MKASILIIDDETTLLKALERFLTGEGYEVVAVREWEKGFELLKSRPFHLLLIDLMLPHLSGIDFIRRCRDLQPRLVSIVMTGFGTIPSAIEAIRAGAYHYLTKPFELADVASLISKGLAPIQLREENRTPHRRLKERFGFENIVGQGESMKNIFHLIEKIADTDSTVLIEGESGTGKELLAQAIHYRSRRAERPFVPVNCAAIPEGLLESELFGHVRGAFTDAVTTQPGKFEQADGGTIFLDEIGDMSPKLQVKVLRVLQDRCITPLGSAKTLEVDIRILAASNLNLEKAVREKRFREDLFYRLNVIPVRLPPLRERREDIPLLANHFLDKYNRANGKKITGFSDEVMDFFKEGEWPGNVRELENWVERLVVFKKEGEIRFEDLPSHLTGGVARSFRGPPFGDLGGNRDGDRRLAFRDLVHKFEAALIRKALLKSGGNQQKAAQLLKLKRTTLIEKMRKMKKWKT